MQGHFIQPMSPMLENIRPEILAIYSSRMISMQRCAVAPILVDVFYTTITWLEKFFVEDLYLGRKCTETVGADLGVCRIPLLQGGNVTDYLLLF